MKITIATLFPKMVEGFFAESIVKRAIEKKLVEIELVNLRDFATDSYGTVDDKPYGGGTGMVMKVEPIAAALQKINVPTAYVVYTSAKGKIFTQQKAQEYSKRNHIILLAGHYEGIDERIMDFVHDEVSLGDFVVTGGEIVVAAITDAVVRLIPGVLKKEATQRESFFSVSLEELEQAVGTDDVLKKLKTRKVNTVRLLEYPQYTRPEEFAGKRVPDVLLSGNHRNIEVWRMRRAYEETKKKRPDLLEK